MTVSSSTNRVNYNGDGSTTVFAYTFKVFDQDDLTVILRSSNGTETVQTITTNYTVSGVGDAGGGNVTMVTAPASGEQLTILREQPLTQGLDLVPNDPFPANSIEESLDKITFMVQTHEEELGRAIKASRTNTISGAEFTVSASDRANKVFAFDSSGDLAVTQELGTFRGDWAASTAYNERDLVKDTSTNNIFIVNSAHTSSGAEPLTTNANSAKYDLIVDAAAATTSATAAATSATAAATSATASATSATAAATSESNAATSATNASTSETNAASSATNASTSASNAAASETAAATSESNAATSATNASTSATNASTSASNAATSESNAAASQSAAATSETNAATSATSAATNATNAATSATNASTAQTAAETAQTAAEAAQAAAELAADNFDDTYLGAKSSDPTVDNDGGALNAGDLYFNTTSNVLKVYSGSAWQEAALDSSGFVTTSSDADIAGTITVDGLTVDGDLFFDSTVTTPTVKANRSLEFDIDNDGNQASAAYKFFADNKTKQVLQVSETGDISFYEDTGTTAKFFWDASAESLGIGTTSPSSKLHIDDADDAASGFRMNNTAGESVQFYYASSAADADFIVNRTGSGAADMGIDHEGNVYFTSGNVGIGTSSPDGRADIAQDQNTTKFTSPHLALTAPNTTNTTGFTGVSYGVSNVTNYGWTAGALRGTTGNNSSFVFTQHNNSASGTERMRIDGSGNVGIGTSSPAYTLSVVKNTTGVNAVDILNSTTGAGSSRLIVRNNSDTNGNGFQIINNANDGVVNLLNYKNTPLAFWTNATERMRIDSSGNLLVGVTSNSSSVAGVTAGNSGLITATRSGTYSAIFNRLSTDGRIVEFRKDSSRVGGIYSYSGNKIIYSSQGTGYLGEDGTRHYAWDAAQFYPTVDNSKDLGFSSFRWDDVRATNGTIQTSDRNEKQQIASMTDAEITAAKAISKLFKTFKWNDSVAEKGDAARTHAGVIAQDVEQAMTDAGLDAGNYAFFISDTWWETYTDMPAVAAVDEVLDDDGNVVTEAVEAQDAYTHTDYFYEADEAPEGATERTRKGIRYPELLSFIGAATEQRLASIESRLDALESA